MGNRQSDSSLAQARRRVRPKNRLLLGGMSVSERDLNTSVMTITSETTRTGKAMSERECDALAQHR